MTKKLIFTCLILIAALSTATAKNNSKNKSTRIDQNLTIFNDVMRQLDMTYVDTINYDLLIKKGIDAMLSYIDPYTIYMSKEEDDEYRRLTTGKYGGIGSSVQQRDSFIYISEPYENMPAALAGLQAGDKLIKIDDMECYGIKVSEASNKLRGVPGTTLQVVVERNNEQITLDITRQDIHIPAVSLATVLQDSIGYIAFSDFSVNSSQEFLVALDDMIQNKHINRLIIDLRGNGGGLIDEANRILSYFIPKGTEVVSVKGKVEKFSHSYYTSTKPIYPDLPLIVLVDNNSASAAEILAGALQDFNRATLIGQRTYGKGLVQNIRPIAYGGHLKVTSAKYYLPSGRCIQAIDYSERQKGNKLTKDSTGGILPDIVLSDSSKLDICYNLYRDFMFFDYATQYKYQHPQIASAEEFQLTDEDIEAFCQFLDEKEYTYETETSKYYKELVDMAKEEDLDSTIMAELNALIPKLSVDYRTAIQRNRSEIEKYLGSEIIKRYYYQRGNLLYLLRYDSEVKRALQEITK